MPDWETLAETLARVMMTTGLSTSEAQLDICRALKDGKLRARYTVERVQTPYRFDLDPRAVGQPRSTFDQRDIIGRPRVPPDLIPDDVDWKNSRPKSPWLDNRGFLALLWQNHVERRSTGLRQCGHLEGGERARAATAAFRPAGRVG